MAEKKPRRDPRDRPLKPEPRLSLKPLNVDDALKAILQVPPMPKGWKPPSGEDGSGEQDKD